MQLRQADVDEQYDKYKELKREDVKNLMEWAKRQPHLPKLTELDVILFLHSCFYSQEFAKTTIDNYYTCRTHCPEMFKNLNPDARMLKNMEVVLFHSLPGLTPDGTRVMYIKLLDKNPSSFHLNDLIKIFAMLSDLWMLRQGPQLGNCILLDMEGGQMGHLLKCGLLTVKKMAFYLQECVPIRRKGVHFINVVPFMDKVINLVRPFVKKEIMEMFYVHANGLDSLYKHIPKHMLPRHLGGDQLTIQEMHDNMKREILQYAEFFQENEKRIVDESKRPGKAKDAGELFGVEGSFKKLEID